MHLFVETNFVLELVFQQEQLEACEQIIVGAEKGKLRLYLPAFSLMEPIYKVDSALKQRVQLANSVKQEISDAAREQSKAQDLQQAARAFNTLLEERNLQQQRRLLEIGHRLGQVAQLIPLTREVWTKAAEFHDATSLRLPDAIVAASVLSGINTLTPTDNKCFATRDNDFKEKGVRQAIEDAGCICLFDFNHAASRVGLK